MKLFVVAYEGAGTIEHWGSRWLMLEGVRRLVELLLQVREQYT